MIMHQNITDILANIADPDQTAPNEQSDLGIHCLLLEHLCPNIEAQRF